jgi:hypothetical protein
MAVATGKGVLLGIDMLASVAVSVAVGRADALRVGMGVGDGKEVGVKVGHGV